MSKYTYSHGAQRAWKWDRDGDVRGYRPPKGWAVEAMIVDEHSITCRPLKKSEWWILETYNLFERG